MSLSQNSFTFLSAKHMPVIPPGMPDLPIVVGQFMGVKGESHITGELWGQDLFCDASIDGYSTKAALETSLDTLRVKAGRLTGTLIEVIGAGTRNWEQCTFIGFNIYPPGPFLDGSGVNGWVAFLRLLWRQRKVG